MWASDDGFFPLLQQQAANYWVIACKGGNDLVEYFTLPNTLRYYIGCSLDQKLQPSMKLLVDLIPCLLAVGAT
jgi:hypothetical protein